MFKKWTLLAALFCVLAGIESASAQYYAHSDFGGYTYRSPYRNHTYSYRYDTGSLYVRNGRLTNFTDAGGAAGVMPSGPAMRQNQTGLRGPSISNLGPSLPTTPGGAPPAPTIGIAAPLPQLTTSTNATAAKTTAPKTLGYSPMADDAWMTKRPFYRTNR